MIVFAPPSREVLWMVDSIGSPQTTGSPIPSAVLHAPAVAAYLHGNSWPTYAPYAVARPDLVRSGRLLSISLSAFHPARCLDVEPGGASLGQVPSWFRNYADRSRGKPVIYTSSSNLSALISIMNGAGIARSDYFIWSAHYTFRSHICAPTVCGYPQADGTQWTDAVPQNCDGSAIFAYVFEPAAPPTPHPITEADMIAATLDRNGGINVFVEKDKSGEVFHAWQSANGAWEGSQSGHQSGPNWHSLGVPGK